ncbi:MAG: hypothetical protein JJ964_05840 [Rhizobiales bacterium]|nr:hypothetical protein [Hyphomicrobiales bacterium]
MKLIPLKSGDEYDALTKARHCYKYLSKPGVKKAIRKRYNKRFRATSKAMTKDLASD